MVPVHQQETAAPVVPACTVVEGGITTKAALCNGGIGATAASPPHLSNPSCPISPGSALVYPGEFITPAEADALATILRNNDAVQREGGFSGPRRLVHTWYVYADLSTAPPLLRTWCDRVAHTTAQQHRPTRVRVEEYVPDHMMQQDMYEPRLLSGFLGPLRCGCETNDADGTTTYTTSACRCFLAEVVLGGSSKSDVAHQSWNWPQQRTALGWSLVSPECWTYVQWNKRSLLLKRGDLLKQWRSTRCLEPVSLYDDNDREEPSPVRVVQFLNGPEESDEAFSNSQDLDFGYSPTPKDEEERKLRLAQPLPPLQDLLTIVITTSPIKSNPSTELMERTMESFENGGHEFSHDCRKIIICDGFREIDNEECGNRVTRKHQNIKQAMRNGIVTSAQAQAYEKFKDKLRELASSSATSSLWNTVEIVELSERYGYGFALRHAVRHCVKTPFVCVIQHDRTFLRSTPVAATVYAMWLHTNVKYVGFTMRSNKTYKDIFRSKYHADTHLMAQWDERILRLPQLNLPAETYGPSCQSVAMSDSQQKIEAYHNTSQGALTPPVVKDENGESRSQCSLVPTLFWYDNVHVCETAHYRDFVYNPTYKMVARGGFVEDKLSPVLKRTVERLGLGEGHARFGCFLLDDHSGLPFTGHFDGGTYMTVADKEALMAAAAAAKKER